MLKPSYKNCSVNSFVKNLKVETKNLKTKWGSPFDDGLYPD